MKKIFMMLAVVMLMAATSCAQSSKPAAKVQMSKSEVEAKLKPFFEKIEALPEEEQTEEKLKTMALEFAKENPNDAGVYVIRAILAYTMSPEELLEFVDGNEYFKEDTTLMEAKKEWQKADCSGSENALEMMKKHGLVNKILEFDYGKVYAKWQNKNLKWFAFLNDNNSTALANMVKEQSDRFFEDFIEHLIGVFGPSNNTRMLCIIIFEQIPDERFKNDALQKVESFKNKRRFENKVIQ